MLLLNEDILGSAGGLLGRAQRRWRASGWVGGGATFHVDGVNGNDGNDGLTQPTAKKTLAAGGTLAAAASTGSTIVVWPATYTEGFSWNTAKVLNMGF